MINFWQKSCSKCVAQRNTNILGQVLLHSYRGKRGIISIGLLEKDEKKKRRYLYFDAKKLAQEMQYQ